METPGSEEVKILNFPKTTEVRIFNLSLESGETFQFRDHPTLIKFLSASFSSDSEVVAYSVTSSNVIVSVDMDSVIQAELNQVYGK